MTAETIEVNLPSAAQITALAGALETVHRCDDVSDTMAEHRHRIGKALADIATLFATTCAVLPASRSPASDQAGELRQLRARLDELRTLPRSYVFVNDGARCEEAAPGGDRWVELGPGPAPRPVCTRAAGHRGRHIATAHEGREVLDQWWNDEQEASHGGD